MKIAIVQFAPVLGNPDKTIEKLETILPKCEGADLVLLPELANSGYNFVSKQQAWNSSEIAGEGFFSKFLIDQASILQCAIVAGLNEREDDKLYNSAILVDKNGLAGKYRKLQLFMNEPEIFEQGNLGLPIFDFMGEKIGILICFDWMYPELWRTLAIRGASLILHPSNLVLPYAQLVMPSYSITNRIFIATANRIGTEGDVTFSGKSIITNPKAEYLCTLSAENEQVYIQEIELSESYNKMLTPNNHAFNDRRLDVYPDLGL